jgi:nucleoside-diphosphate-sugar epimerase
MHSKGEGEMSILVIGGTGFIGPRVIKRLAARGEDIVCMDINPGAASFAGLEDQVTVVRGDVTQFEDVMRVAIETKPARLLNLSYLLGGGEGNPHHQLRLNILGMDNCFEVARLCGIRRVVYASSVAVSGLQRHFGERMVTEDDPKFGTSQYAMHKIFNEFQAAQYIKNYGMSITGVRPANVTGPDKVRGSTDHVQLITLPARGQSVRMPGKSFMRLPIHVEDIAEVFVRVLSADAPRHPIYNSGGIPISLGELADIVQEFIPEAQITFDSDGGLEDSGTYLVDNSRLRQEFDVEYPPFRTRVLEIINDVRRQEGLPLIEAR